MVYLATLSVESITTECEGGSVAYRGGVWGVQTPPAEIPKALQNRAKLNPTVKTVKNC